MKRKVAVVERPKKPVPVRAERRGVISRENPPRKGFLLPRLNAPHIEQATDTFAVGFMADLEPEDDMYFETRASGRRA